MNRRQRREFERHRSKSKRKEMSWEARTLCGCLFVMTKWEDLGGPISTAGTDLKWTPCAGHDHLRDLAEQLPDDVVRDVTRRWPPTDETVDRIEELVT